MYWDIVFQVSGLDYTTTDTTATPPTITGLSAPLVANNKYEYEVRLVGQSSSSAGVRYRMNFSAAGASGTWYSVCSSTTTGVASFTNLYGSVQSPAWTTASTDESLYISGIIVVGANSGNLTVDLNKVTSGTATVFIGSILKLKYL